VAERQPTRRSLFGVVALLASVFVPVVAAGPAVAASVPLPSVPLTPHLSVGDLTSRKVTVGG
jgi:hypothetical protein